MPSPNDEIQAFLEKRDSERVLARLKIRFRVIERKEADKYLAAGDYTEIFSSSNLDGEVDGEGLADAITENISISGLKLVGDLRLHGSKELKEGNYLLVGVELPEVPIPVHALATVIWSEPHAEDKALYTAGLFFVAINKADVMRVARFLVLQRRAKHA